MSQSNEHKQGFIENFRNYCALMNNHDALLKSSRYGWSFRLDAISNELQNKQGYMEEFDMSKPEMERHPDLHAFSQTLETDISNKAFHPLNDVDPKDTLKTTGFSIPATRLATDNILIPFNASLFSKPLKEAAPNMALSNGGELLKSGVIGFFAQLAQHLHKARNFDKLSKMFKNHQLWDIENKKPLGAATEKVFDHKDDKIKCELEDFVAVSTLDVIQINYLNSNFAPMIIGDKPFSKVRLLTPHMHASLASELYKKTNPQTTQAALANLITPQEAFIVGDTLYVRVHEDEAYLLWDSNKKGFRSPIYDISALKTRFVPSDKRKNITNPDFSDQKGIQFMGEHAYIEGFRHIITKEGYSNLFSGEMGLYDIPMSFGGVSSTLVEFKESAIYKDEAKTLEIYKKAFGQTMKNKPSLKKIIENNMDLYKPDFSDEASKSGKIQK